MSNTIKNNILWKNFRIAALNCNKKVSEIAAEVGVSRVSIFYFLRGDRKLAAATIERLCKALNVPSDFFENEVL